MEGYHKSLLFIRVLAPRGGGGGGGTSKRYHQLYIYNLSIHDTPYQTMLYI